MSIKTRLSHIIDRKARKKRLELINEALKAKRSLLIEDEVGLSFPINVSVIIPTFLRETDDLFGYRFEVIRNELMVLGQLLTRGLVDEIMIVDGSRTPEGEMEESLIRQIISSAYRSIPLFHDQVDLLNKFPALKSRAKLGLYDFVFKVIHQLDSNIQRATSKMKLSIPSTQAGKGSALWLLVYLDSDIRNLEGWHVASLLLPILCTFDHDQNAVELVKAYYARLAVNIDTPEKGFYKLGGRVTRLFVIPFIKVLAKHSVLDGLEKFRYPLAGEFAVKRRFIESLRFPVDYGIESGILIEIWKKKMLNKVLEADLHLYQHFPRNDRLIGDMVAQIIDLLVRELDGLIELEESIADEYSREAYKEIERTQRLYEEVEVKREVAQNVRRSFYKDEEGDRIRVENYVQILRNTLKSGGMPKKRVKKMPPWEKLVRTFDGKNFQNRLRRRAVNYTFQILGKQGIISYD